MYADTPKGAMEGAPKPGSILSFYPSINWSKDYPRVGMVIDRRVRRFECVDDFHTKYRTEFRAVLHMLWEDGTTSWTTNWEFMKRIA